MPSRSINRNSPRKRQPSKPGRAGGPLGAKTPVEKRPPGAPGRPEGFHRLQKVLALAGHGSRRKCEELITTGRVEVDGQVVVELGTKVDPQQQEVRVDGVSIRKNRFVYYLVNKPAGVVSTNDDPAGRPRVVDLIPPSTERIYTVGRLDMSSEGLMLVTNDGDLANQLTHPRYGVEKTYQVVVAGEPTREDLEKLTRGVHLAEGVARASRVVLLSTRGESSTLEIVLQEGKNREIRRLLADIGHKVLRLKRIAISHLRLKNLPSGGFRRLTREELQDLRRSSRRGTRDAAPGTSERQGHVVLKPQRKPTRGRLGQDARKKKPTGKRG